MYLFATRPLWKEINVIKKLVKDLYREYLGMENQDILTRKDAINFLFGITKKIQEEMTRDMRDNSSLNSIKDLYKILDEVYHFYRRQKDARSKMREAGIK